MRRHLRPLFVLIALLAIPTLASCGSSKAEPQWVKRPAGTEIVQSCPEGAGFCADFPTSFVFPTEYERTEHLSYPPPKYHTMVKRGGEFYSYYVKVYRDDAAGSNTEEIYDRYDSSLWTCQEGGASENDGFTCTSATGTDSVVLGNGKLYVISADTDDPNGPKFAEEFLNSFELKPIPEFKPPS